MQTNSQPDSDQEPAAPKTYLEVEFDGEILSIDLDGFVPDELSEIAMTLAEYAFHYQADPTMEIKAAAVALQAIRRNPVHGDLQLVDVYPLPELPEPSAEMQDMSLQEQLAHLEKLVS